MDKDQIALGLLNCFVSKMNCVKICLYCVHFSKTEYDYALVQVLLEGATYYVDLLLRLNDVTFTPTLKSTCTGDDDHVRCRRGRGVTQ